jgi:hypothetical protein
MEQGCVAREIPTAVLVTMLDTTDCHARSCFFFFFIDVDNWLSGKGCVLCNSFGCDRRGDTSLGKSRRESGVVGLKFSRYVRMGPALPCYFFSSSGYSDEIRYLVFSRSCIIHPYTCSEYRKIGRLHAGKKADGFFES